MSSTLLEHAQKYGAPIIDENTATFIWQGKRPPRLMGDFTLWHQGSPVEMKAAGPDLWTYTLELPTDAYIEYVYRDGDQRFLDPLNKYVVPNGMGKINNYFGMPQYRPTELARRKRGAPKGKTVRQVLKTEGFLSSPERVAYFYQPPVDGPVPLVVVWDGFDYLRRARLPVIVDNLVLQKRIRPVALAMVQNGGLARLQEYSCSDVTLGFLQSVVLPTAQKLLNLSQETGSYGVMGASMGGLMALYTGYRLPEIFGKVLSQSGAFTVITQDTVIYDLIQNGIKKPLRIWMDIGKYDFGSLTRANPRMLEILRGRGYDVTYREYPAGHNYPAWRDNVWRGLEHLFGSPG